MTILVWRKRPITLLLLLCEAQIFRDSGLDDDLILEISDLDSHVTTLILHRLV